ncbi:MAG TPA: ABC transporter ATP-binding protein [Candidatus Dormibacteraeota bacterium]|nr:ABC transporter ATP-binding protein [Candidatus Dormibacteraeota bacterium]
MTSLVTPADLQVEGITVRFSGLTALDRVSVSVREGEIVGIIGPNGAGKTTLFNAICGLVRPQTGTISYRGRSLLGLAPHRLIRLGIARTLQGLGLWPSLTVLENVVVGAARRPSFGSALLGLPGSWRTERELAERATGILAELGISEVAGAHPRSLPYGVQKRVSIARGLMAEPSLLLLDEPASGLSKGEVDELAHLLNSVRVNTTMAIVDHNVDLVMEASDRVVVLNFGKVIADGTPEAIRSDPEVAKAYLGEAVVEGGGAESA